MVMHRYTYEEREFLKDFIPGHYMKEIAEEFNKRFENPITVEQVKYYMYNNKMPNGLKGCFPKGNVPHNKGAKGICAKGCEKTWFEKGHLPHNTKPIGYERITRDGYIEVKVKMRPSRPNCNDNFVAKHRLIWEEAHGSIPKGCKLMFLDGNKQNVELSNLALVTNGEEAVVNRRGLKSNDPELTKVGIALAKVKISVSNAKKKNGKHRD